MAVETYVAFVRAVMTGREGLHREVLLDMIHQAGGVDGVSYLATGNASFGCPPGRIERLVDQFELKLEELLNRPTPVFVRSLESLSTMLGSDPFAEPPFSEVRDRVLTFCPSGLEHRLDLPFAPPNGDWIAFASRPGVVFSVTRAWPDRQPQAPGGAIERAVGAQVTSRALGTVERIVSKLTNGG